MTEPTARVRELKAEMDRLTEDVDYDDEPTPDERAVYSQTLQAFRAAGPEVLVPATEHLWAYYRRIAGEFTEDEQDRYRIPRLHPDEDIWQHVSIHGAMPSLGGTVLEPARSYLSFEGSVAWEPEHGLQLVLADGAQVCKVGPYDGHVTVAHAYGDVSLLGRIFR